MSKYLKLLLPILLIIVMGLTVSCIQVVSPSGSTQEGIEVHGDWTITVSNPDGTVDSVQKFSNDLNEGAFSTGADLLSILLASQGQITAWTILINTAPETDCQEKSATGGGWVELDSIVTRDASMGTPLRLTGTCTISLSDPSATTQIGTVRTRAFVAETTPTSSMLSPPYDTVGTSGTFSGQSPIALTNKDIPTSDRVDLQHNQVVSFNVVISFQ